MRAANGSAMGKVRVAAAGILLAAASVGMLCGQDVYHDPDTPKPPHRLHLILKDGSYQIVLSYTVSGNLVRYVSAERSGEKEEIPVELVDLEATHRWEQQHSDQGRPPAIDPELLKEEQERSARTPEVEPDLRLPEDDSTLVLDEFQGKPELVPLVQTDGELNRTTSHNVLKQVINPRSASHQVVTLHGVKSYVQVHVDTPEFYMRVGDDAPATTGSAPLVVDTHGTTAKIESDLSAQSRYVSVRADVRVDARVIASFNIAALGGDRHVDNVTEMKAETLRGGHWMKLTPETPLDIGEYVLMEVLSDKEINLGVWDFGVHPTAPENRDVLKPVPKRRPDLERRKPD